MVVGDSWGMRPPCLKSSVGAGTAGSSLQPHDVYTSIGCTITGNKLFFDVVFTPFPRVSVLVLLTNMHIFHRQVFLDPYLLFMKCVFPLSSRTEHLANRGLQIKSVVLKRIPETA